MKKTNQFLQAVLASAATAVMLQANASAQAVNPLNTSSPLIVNTLPSNTGPAGTTGADGYDLFHFNPNSGNNGFAADPTTNLVSLPSYVTNLTFDSSLLQYDTPDSITVGGTSYGDGLFYSPTYDQSAVANPLTGALGPQTFLTFELTGSVPSAFDLGVLRDYIDNTVYTLSLYSGTPSPATLLSTAAISSGTETSYANQFFYGEVSGATAGDYIVITGAPPGTGENQVTIGGITFDSVATPEPSTVALMLAGLGSLALVARLRRNNA